MPSTEAPISITVKTAAGSLVTVRAESADELDQVVALSLASVSSAVHELEAAVRNGNAAVPPNPTAASIAHQFNTTVTSPAVPVTDSFDAAPAFVAPSMGAGSRNCPHGTMTRIHGLTGKFGPYKGYFCPAKQGDMTKCTTQYIKQNQAEWNSFQADQTKA
jgi:hypothetical protein